MDNEYIEPPAGGALASRGPLRESCCMNRESIITILTATSWWAIGLRVLFFFLVAWLIHRLSGRLARRIVRISYLAPRGQPVRPERQSTLHSVIASAIGSLAFVAAILATLGQFVDLDTLVWVVGLFSAAFGLGARPLISDLLAGFGLIFEDTFAVGEKVEILDVAGVVEAVNLRTTLIRAPSGELYVMPNGEIRVVRNFSRGRFSLLTVKIKVPSAELSRTLPQLEALGKEALTLLPNLLEPWTVLSESGVVGQHTELTLLAKAWFGKAADMRPRLLALLQEQLAEAGIELLD